MHVGVSLEFENLRACPFCGNRSWAEVYSANESGVLNIHVICKRCALVFQNPRLTADSLERLYSSLYPHLVKNRVTPEGRPSIRTIAAAERKATRLFTALRSMLHDVSRHTVLDIGCGTGALLNLFKAEGYATFGVEPNPAFAEFAREGGHTVDTGYFDGKSFEGEIYGVVTLSHVLEHSPDPIVLIKGVAAQLEEGGVMAVEVPNVERPNRSLNGFFQLPHLFSFSAASLLHATLRGGFTNVLLLDTSFPHLRLIARKTSKGEKIRHNEENLGKTPTRNWRILFLRIRAFALRDLITDPIIQLGNRVATSLLGQFRDGEYLARLRQYYWRVTGK